MTLPLFPTREPNTTHRCHARDCEVAIRPELLMCLKHWMLVPKPIQRLVWAGYRPGQCDDKRPSRQWHQAADAAIGYVARFEGRRVTETEAEALASFGYGESP